MIFKKVLLGLSTTLLIFTSACSNPFASFHRKSLEIVADIKGVELPQENNKNLKSNDLVFDFVVPKYHIIRPELLEISEAIINNMDEYYEKKQFISDEELPTLYEKLELFETLQSGNSQFDEDSLNDSETSLYSYIRGALLNLSYTKYPIRYIESISKAKQLIGMPMKYEHQMKYIESLSVISRVPRGDLFSDNVLSTYIDNDDVAGAFRYLRTKMNFSMDVTLSNDDFSLIKINYKYSYIEKETGNVNKREDSAVFQLVDYFPDDPWTPVYTEVDL